MLAWAFRYFVMAALVAGGVAVLKAETGGDVPAADEKHPHVVREAAVQRQAPPALETVLEPDRQGHYWVEAVLDGEPVTFIVDTGASDVILAPADAKKLGIRTGGLRFDRRYQTANGEITGAVVRLRELRIGQQSVYGLDAVVVDAPLRVSLLGMDFLRRLDGFEVRGGRLVLRW